MNDRFKFRTWDKEINKFRYGDVALGCNGKPFVITCDPEKPIEYLDNVEVNFCTGLKDRNGKLIYEGDIVTIFHSEEYKGVIKYNQDWVSFWIGGKGIAYNALNTIRHDYFIKLGDIYTAPELLEAQNG